MEFAGLFSTLLNTVVSHSSVVISFVVAVSVALVLWVFISKKVRPKYSHRWRIKLARKKLDKIRRLKNPRICFGFMRKRVEPLVFEEMILTAIKDAGGKIKRNKAYTGDGGVDGECKIKGVRYLIQAKLYDGPIKKAHVIDFTNVCKARGCKGLFVHTGKSTKGVKTEVQASSDVLMVSGSKLLKFLDGNSLKQGLNF